LHVVAARAGLDAFGVSLLDRNGGLVTDVASEKDTRAIAVEAFLFGYPLVLMDLTRAVMTNVAQPQASSAPENQIGQMRAFPDASFTDVVSPNADTLYSVAWLDVSAEPVVLRQPDGGDRYFLLPMLDGWTNVFASPGTRTTGSGAAVFAIVGPRWSGELPDDVQEIRSPTGMVWMIGRTQTNGKADYDNVHHFQDGITLTPLSAWGSDYSPPADAQVDPDVEMTTPPPDVLEAMDARAFFGRLAALMVDNPPADDDAPALERFAAIGLAPGSFKPAHDLVPELDEGLRAGMAKLKELAQEAVPPINGWAVFRGLGSYGTEYGKRALVALLGLGANLDADAMYPHATMDADGQPLTGSNRYVLHFEPDQMPPAGAFWSLTMYNEHQFFVDNPLDRYAIGDRDPLAFNDDGSLDIWFQHDRPDPDRESNWLPAPAGSFNVFLRVYWPKPEMLDGTWVPPAITKL
jgi:hypothetical protein